MMIKRTKIWAVVGMVLTSIWSYGQTVDQVVNDLDAERYTAANDGAKKLVATAPSESSYFLQGYTILNSPEYYKAENLAAAKAAFEAGIATGKKGSNLNQIGLAMVKLASKDLAGGKAILEEVKKATKSKDPEILYRIAEAYTLFPEANDAAEAVLTIDLALDKHKTKDNPEYYFVKADAYTLKNDAGSAMNALANAERIGKKLGKTYAKMAKLWLQSRNYRDALDVINKGVVADPTYAPIYKYESTYYQIFADYKKSADAAMNYLKNSDGDTKAKIRYAKLAYVAKDYPNLKVVLNEIKGTTEDPYLYRIEGILNYEEGKYAQSIEDFKKFIAANPKDENFSFDYGNIGKAYIKMGADAESDSLGILNIEKAMSLADSTSGDFYTEAAALLKEKGNMAKAAELTEKSVLAKKDANASDFASLATVYFQGRNYAKASEFLEKALVEYKDAWPAGYALNGLAKTYRDMNDPEKSAQYLGAGDFEKYLSLLGEDGKKNPANKSYVVTALKALAGRDFLLNKDMVAAKAKIEELLTIAPEDEDALRMLETFNKELNK